MRSIYVWLVISLVSLGLTSGCRSTGAQSQLNIFGGSDIQAVDYPEVVRFAAGGVSSGHCTGTFVSPTTLITATHCLVDAKTGGIAVHEYENGFPARQGAYSCAAFTTLADGEAIPTSEAPLVEDPTKDLAVVVFPRALTDSYARLPLATIANGDPATYVGFGLSNLQDPFSGGLKRKATNTLKSIAENGAILTTGSSGILPGDSGGPMFLGASHDLIGVASRINYVPGSQTARDQFHVDVKHPKVVELLKTSVAGGAVISGFDYTPGSVTVQPLCAQAAANPPPSVEYDSACTIPAGADANAAFSGRIQLFIDKVAAGSPASIVGLLKWYDPTTDKLMRMASMLCKPSGTWTDATFDYKYLWECKDYPLSPQAGQPIVRVIHAKRKSTGQEYKYMEIRVRENDRLRPLRTGSCAAG